MSPWIWIRFAGIAAVFFAAGNWYAARFGWPWFAGQLLVWSFFAVAARFKGLQR